MVRSPRADWLPCESLRRMTAPRRPRSAWSLVGSTSGTPAKLHSAGQRFSRFLAKLRWRRLRAALARRLLEQRPELLLERAEALAEAGAVSVPAALVPGGEQPSGDLEAGRAELLLGAEPLAVGGEVAHEVRPTELAPLRVEVVERPTSGPNLSLIHISEPTRLGMISY